MSPAPVAVSPAATAPAVHGQILAVGASVMLAAIDELHHQLHATVDAAVNRQPYQIIDRLAAYRSAHALPPIVVVQIGENGPLSSTDVQRLRTVLRGVRLVVLTNLRYPGESWIDATNRQLAHLAATWPNARLADWRSASADPHLLWDGTHPDPAGAVVYARTIARTIGG
ncbi:MAG: hypothetical protein JO222_15145 [Frankiales bacterium]|nr:hypothetical protein [Frankiales bacterium]